MNIMTKSTIIYILDNMLMCRAVSDYNPPRISTPLDEV